MELKNWEGRQGLYCHSVIVGRELPSEFAGAPIGGRTDNRRRESLRSRCETREQDDAEGRHGALVHGLSSDSVCGS